MKKYFYDTNYHEFITSHFKGKNVICFFMEKRIAFLRSMSLFFLDKKRFLGTNRDENMANF